MIRTLPSPVRGCTHAVLTDVFFDLRAGLAYCRGELGTADEQTVSQPDAEPTPELVFVADPDLKPFYVQWQGEGFAALYDVLDSTPLIAALDAAGWGFSAPPPA